MHVHKCSNNQLACEAFRLIEDCASGSFVTLLCVGVNCGWQCSVSCVLISCSS